MSSFNLSGPDAVVNDKIQIFKTGFAANASALGFDTADVDEVLAAATSFNTALIASTTAREAAKGAVVTKDAAKQSATTIARTYAQRVKTNPLATPAILSSMGITPGVTPSGPLVPPNDLTAAPKSDGSCFLKWKRNGNSRGTVYVLESKIGAFGAWVWQANVTGLRYTDFGAIAGQQKSYRVRAQRAGATSAPSSAVVIYDLGGESEVLQAA